jgi:hypothetical protein
MNNSYPKTTYTKLFQKILHSTIWCEDDRTRLVWITMLAMSDGDGCVVSSLPGLAHAARVDLEACRMAVAKFMAPDLESSSKEHDGRRIEEIDGGWRLLNHAKYKSMMTLEHRRDYNRLKQQEYRDKVRKIDKEKTMRQVIKERVSAEDSLDAPGV